MYIFYVYVWLSAFEILSYSLYLASVVSLRFACFFFQAEDGIRDLVRSRGLGDVYKRQVPDFVPIAVYTSGMLYTTR